MINFTYYQSIRHLSVAWLLVLFVAACSNDKPTITLAKDYLAKGIDTAGQGRLKLADFDYLKNKEVNYGGEGDGYVILWKADLEFLEDSYWPVDPDLLKTAPADQPPNPIGESKLYKKGERVVIKGKYHFDKDNGVWTIIGSEYLRK